MKTYRVESSEACWVTFVHTVEAENEDDARDQYINGQAIPVDTDIGDIIEGYDTQLTINEVQS